MHIDSFPIDSPSRPRNGDLDLLDEFVAVSGVVVKTKRGWRFLEGDAVMVIRLHHRTDRDRLWFHHCHSAR